MNLRELIKEVKAENKLDSEQIFTILTKSIEIGDSEECTYKEIYMKAYGPHLNSSTATEWVKNVGEKWTMDQTTNLGQRMGIDWNCMNKYELWAVMNAWYSDYYKVAQKYELEDETEFYYDLVYAYFNDDDAHDKTVSNYYFSFVA